MRPDVAVLFIMGFLFAIIARELQCRECEGSGGVWVPDPMWGTCERRP